MSTRRFFSCLFVCLLWTPELFLPFFFFFLVSSRYTHTKWLIGVIRLQMSHLGFLLLLLILFSSSLREGALEKIRKGEGKKRKEAIGKYRTLPKCQTTFNMAGYWCFRRGTKLRLKIFERGKNTTRADSAPGSVSFDAHTRGLIN